MGSTFKTRYVMLDALRGVAAIVVMLYHFSINVRGTNVVTHGYLAVDFFFILSGFIVSNAYSERLAELGLVNFCKLRMKRLLPMSICGVVIGTVFLVIRWQFEPRSSDDLPHLLAASGLNLFLIPKLWTGRASGHAMFPANGVLWSLLLELLANIFWAAFLVHRKTVTLVIAAATGWLVFAIYAWHHGDSSVGWNWSTLIGGIGRIAFGFLAGVLLWRFRAQAEVSPFLGWFSGIGFILIFCLPTLSWWVEVMIVLCILPPLVYFTAASASSEEGVVVRVLGDISYPVYAIHWPLAIAVSTYLKWYRPTELLRPDGYLLCIPIVALAYLIERFYDRPTRRWLAGPYFKLGHARRLANTEPLKVDFEIAAAPCESYFTPSCKNGGTGSKE